MEPDGDNRHVSEQDKALARSELRRSIQNALDCGIGWPDIIRMLAEHGPGLSPSADGNQDGGERARPSSAN
jgi:hypothetical protein